MRCRVSSTLRPNKKKSKYKCFFDAVKNIVPHAKPEYYSCDFESAAISTFDDAFSDAEIAEASHRRRQLQE